MWHLVEAQFHWVATAYKDNMSRNTNVGLRQNVSPHFIVLNDVGDMSGVPQRHLPVM